MKQKTTIAIGVSLLSYLVLMGGCDHDMFAPHPVIIPHGYMVTDDAKRISDQKIKISYTHLESTGAPIGESQRVQKAEVTNPYEGYRYSAGMMNEGENLWFAFYSESGERSSQSEAAYDMRGFLNSGQAIGANQQVTLKDIDYAYSVGKAGEEPQVFGGQGEMTIDENKVQAEFGEVRLNGKVNGIDISGEAQMNGLEDESYGDFEGILVSDGTNDPDGFHTGGVFAGVSDPMDEEDGFSFAGGFVK